MTLSELLNALNDRVLRGGDWYRTVAGWPKEAQHVWTTHYLEAEVLNGGFSQFFFNTWGQFAREAQAGYVALGAPKHASETARAIKIYELTYPTHRRFGEGGQRPTKAPPPRLFELVEPHFSSLQGEETVALRKAFVVDHADRLGSF